MTEPQTPQEEGAAAAMTYWLQRATRWRMLFAGRLFGTMPDNPQASAAKDLFEKWIIMRAECSALAGLLIEKGLIEAMDFTNKIAHEAEMLDRMYEHMFDHSVRSEESGLIITDPQKLAEITKDWPA